MTTVSSEPRQQLPPALRSALVLGLIYFFLVGVSSLEKGIKIMGEDTQERLFSAVTNPIAGLCVGILGTVLVQSSSARPRSSLVWSHQGHGRGRAIPMVMGANIGTTVTNTLVSLGHVQGIQRIQAGIRRRYRARLLQRLAVAILLAARTCHRSHRERGRSQSARYWLASAGTNGRARSRHGSRLPSAGSKTGWGAVGASGNLSGHPHGPHRASRGVASPHLITKNMRKLVADRVERSINAILGKVAERLP